MEGYFKRSLNSVSVNAIQERFNFTLPDKSLFNTVTSSIRQAELLKYGTEKNIRLKVATRAASEVILGISLSPLRRFRISNQQLGKHLPSSRISGTSGLSHW